MDTSGASATDLIDRMISYGVYSRQTKPGISCLPTKTLLASNCCGNDENDISGPYLLLNDNGVPSAGVDEPRRIIMLIANTITTPGMCATNGRAFSERFPAACFRPLADDSIGGKDKGIPRFCNVIRPNSTIF